MSNQPLLGLLVDRAADPALAQLLSRLEPWCRPAVVGADTDTAAAWLSTSPATEPPDGRPWAAWVTSDDDASGADRVPDVLLTGDATVAASHPDAVVVPAEFDPHVAVPVAPFVRARWRESAGLPATAVLVASDNGMRVDGAEVPPELDATALATCSAAVVRGERLREALAWGTPTVTDGASAAREGAIDGRHVIVADDPEDALAAAHALGDDPRLSARLAWAGRLLVEDRYDLAARARHVADRLGLTSQAVFGAVRARLSELGAPTTGRIVGRVAAATAALQEGV